MTLCHCRGRRIAGGENNENRGEAGQENGSMGKGGENEGRKERKLKEKDE